MRRDRMKTKCNGFIFVLLFVLSGCAIKQIEHDYTWSEYQIYSDQVRLQNSITKGREVRIIQGKSDNSKIFLGSIYVGHQQHRYYGSLQSLTDGIADQLAKELQNRNLIINNTSEKSLEITVIRSNFDDGMLTMGATLDFTVKFGNGIIKSYTVRKSSFGTVPQTYNGAVSLAIIEIMNDRAVQTYINE